jgi:predicted PurR-regulated permease PerM
VFGIDLRVARTVWTVAAVAALLYCVYMVRRTLLVMLFAVFFSYLVYPLLVVLERRAPARLSRTALLSLVFATVLGLVALAGALFGSQIAAQATALSQQLPTLLEPTSLARRLPLPHLLEPYRDRLAEFFRMLLTGAQAEGLTTARSIGAGLVHAAGNLIYAVVVPIFSFLMILAVPDIEAWLAGPGARTHGTLWVSLAHDLNFLFSRYVRALGLLSLAALVTYGAVLSLLGAPYALLLAGVAAVLEVIPVFGPLAGAITILSVAAFSGYEHVWWLLAFIIAYRIVQDYMLNPYLMSEGVNVPPILVVFGLLAGDELAGVPGIFLSVPVIAAIRIVMRRVRAHQAALKREASADD